MKSPQEKAPPANCKTIPSKIDQEGTSINEKQLLETAKRDILESLNITSHDSSKGSTRDSQLERAASGEEELAKRVDESLQSIQETRDTVNRLSNILNAVSAASDDVPADVVIETVPVNETSIAKAGESLHVGDAIVHAALTGGLNQPSTFDEEYSEPVQPVDTITPSSDVITFAGEIVGAPSNIEHQLSFKDAPQGDLGSGVKGNTPEASTFSLPVSIHDDVTGTADQSAASPQAVTPSKKSKRQLAVSFTSSSTN